jgi:hypothetical protein
MRKLFQKEKPAAGQGKQKPDTLESEILDEKLKEKIKAESHKYDFKIIKRKLTD